MSAEKRQRVTRSFHQTSSQNRVGCVKRSGRTDKASEHGIALLIVMWIVVILSTIVVSYAYQAKLEVRMMRYQMCQARARHIAKAGLSRALVYIREDILKDNDDFPERREPIIDVMDEDEGVIMPYDAYIEAWHANEDNYEEIEFGGGLLNVEVLDESARLNFNSPFVYSNQDMVKALLMYLGNEEETAQAVSAAIVDWIDEDNEPSKGGEGREWGDEETEDLYYNPEQGNRDIEETGPQYVNKNAPLDTLEELLLIRGVTPLIFFGEDANGNGELDDNEDDGSENPPDDNEDGDLLLGLRDFTTVYSNRFVNFNTAPWQVIAAILYPKYEDDADGIAEDIIDYRDGSDGEPGTDDDKPMRTLDDSDQDGYHFGEIDNFSQGDISQLSNIITRGSDYFRVISTGEYEGVSKTLTAIVWRSYDPGRLTESEERGREREEDEPLPEKVLLTILSFNEQVSS